MNALRGMMAKSCTVVRGGEERSIDPALLVPGDLVRLRLGERVPADVRVIHTRDLKTEVRELDTTAPKHNHHNPAPPLLLAVATAASLTLPPRLLALRHYPNCHFLPLAAILHHW